MSFDLFPLSFFSVVPLCRCWRPEGTRHSQDWAVRRCSYPAHKHYQTFVHPARVCSAVYYSQASNLAKSTQRVPYARRTSMKSHNRPGYVNISQLIAEEGNDPLPVQRTVFRGQTLSRCYVLCSKPL